MAIPQEVLSEILARSDIVSVVSEHVILKKAGKDYKGLCPFHSEKSPSFMVSPSKGIFHCFGCSVGGNAFSFLMKKEGLGFLDAVEKIASQVGVDLSRYQNKKNAEEEDPLYKINRYAQWLFRNQLEAEIKKGFSYLKERGINEEMSALFGLGLSGTSWTGLADFLSSRKVPIDLAAQLGLVRSRSDGSYYDFYRGRLMFPIYDTGGRIIGFGGRSLGLTGAAHEEAKYLNSSDSAIYRKNHSLYGYYQSKLAIREKRQVIVVEGYIDLIKMFQHGFKNVVAPLGTALTESQINLLKKSVDEFVLFFDGDEAGLRAARRVLPVFLAMGLFPKIVVLPDNHDPDSFLEKRGKEALQKELNSASDAMLWFISDIISKTGGQLDRKREAVHVVQEMLGKIANLSQRGLYQSQLDQLLGVAQTSAPRYTKKFSKDIEKTRVFDTTRKISLERILLQLYVKFTSLVHPFIPLGVFLEFRDPDLKEFALDFSKATAEGRPPRALDEWDESVRGKITALFFCEFEFVSDQELLKFVKDTLGSLKKQYLKDDMVQLKIQIYQAELKKDEGGVQKLLDELNQKARSLKELREI